MTGPVRTVVATTALAVVYIAALSLIGAGGSVPAGAATGSPGRTGSVATSTATTGSVATGVVAADHPAAATPIVAAAPGQMIVTGRDAPDPFLLTTGGKYYLYTSEGNQAGNFVPVQSGTTLGQLGPLRDAMPTLPGWAVPGFTWAPDVHRFDNYYVMYFTSIVATTDPPDECIGIAVAASPTGPFLPEQQPFVCQLDQRGSIDPRTFTDADGTTYLIWKSDDNADVTGTELTNVYAQPLSAGGLALLGQPTRIFGPDEPWQGRIVEAPDLVEVGGVYWLFYSGGWFNQPAYAIGVARCTGPLGPCADTSPVPWLGSNVQGQGPGEPSVFLDSAGAWLLYTPWRSLVPSFTTPPRPVAMLRLGFGPDGPYVAAPGAGPGRAPDPPPTVAALLALPSIHLPNVHLAARATRR